MSDLEKLPPTFRKAIEQARALHGLGLIFGGLAAFGIGGTKMKKLSHHTKHLVYRAEELANLPQDFNRRFQLEGWLISDSTSVEAAKKAIILYDQKKITEANTLLSTEFYGENLDFLLMRMKSIPEFRPRFEIARSAAALCQARQFTAAIPLIFIVLDGTASDAFGKSIFAEGIDVSETNAIAGSADSFPELIAIVSKIRRRTNVEEIFFPFRNGIIHGKDVNYGNRLVSAKCWSLLSCLCDILRAKQTIQEAEDERPLFELLKQYLRTKEDSKRLEEWSPRDDIEIAGEGAIGDQDFLVASPEYLLCEF